MRETGRVHENFRTGFGRRRRIMVSLGKIIRDDKHPVWLVDAIVLSAVVYSSVPEEELKIIEQEYGLPATARYEFVAEKELRENGYGNCKQTLLVVRSLVDSHYIVACRGSSDISDALVDLRFLHRTMSLTPGAAHAGFLDRAKTIPLEYFRRLLVRGENVVLAGHSLGGAVASLLALRLLEATGRWCHAQLQCYTFGCPFFADSRLARYINKHYQQHFVHVVSQNDIVPKVMPLAYTIFNMWAGLNVGPLHEVLHLVRVGTFGLQFFKLKPKELPLVMAGTQALTWVPTVLRFLLHRALALVLSYQSGRGYSFAGHMVLLDTQSNFLEYTDRQQWKMGKHLKFHLNCGSLDIMKEHSLMNYIDHVFAIESSKQASSSQLNQDVGLAAAPVTATTTKVTAAAATTIDDEAAFSTLKVEVCSATLSMDWPADNNGNTHHPQQTFVVATAEQGKEEEGMVSETQVVTMEQGEEEEEEEEEGMVAETQMVKELVPGKILRSRVACLIFVRRMQEASPKGFIKPRFRKPPGMMELAKKGFCKVTKFVHHFDIFFLASSVVCVMIQVKRYLVT